MKNFMDLVKSRRSIRKFKPDPVDDNLVNTLLEAVQWTPSWANTQCWEIVVVKSSDIKSHLAATIPKENPGARAVADAPVVFALCARPNRSGFHKGTVTTKFGDWFMFDIGMAAQSISLCAHALGLGSVAIGLFDHVSAKAILNMPKDIELVALMPVGYPAVVPASAPKRRDIDDFVQYNSFFIQEIMPGL